MVGNIMRYHEKTLHLFPHGIMFHHFHDSGHHYKSEGSISASDFQRIIDFVGQEHILDPHEWARKSAEGTLAKSDVCFSFDDSLKCQIDVALPVLRKNNLRAFFFVYSSVFEGHIARLEMFRYLRNVGYESLEAFYDDFYATGFKSDLSEKLAKGLTVFPGESYLADFPFYSLADRKYRFVRDQVLAPREYDKLVDVLMQRKIPDIASVAKTVWMNRQDLKELTNEGHAVGLHSFSHPMQMAKLSAEDQRAEYQSNFELVKDTTGVIPWSMSHPCNSYNADTLSLLNTLGITTGFCANVKFPMRSGLEFPREDHVNVISALVAA